MEELKFKADTIFIQYEDCISCLAYSVIKYLLENEKEYEEYIDFSKIKNKSDKSLVRIALMRRTSNILKYLSKEGVEWDCKKSLQQIENNYADLYKNGYKLTLFNTITNFLFEPSFKTIFIYHPNPDKRYIKDLFESFDYTKNIDKIHLVFNDNLKETLDVNDDISCFFVSNMRLAKYLLENNYVDNREILISETRYNIYANEEKILMPIMNIDKFINETNKTINYGLVKPLNMDKSYFEDLIKSNQNNK